MEVPIWSNGEIWVALEPHLHHVYFIAQGGISEIVFGVVVSIKEWAYIQTLLLYRRIIIWCVCKRTLIPFFNSYFNIFTQNDVWQDRNIPDRKCDFAKIIYWLAIRAVFIQSLDQIALYLTEFENFITLHQFTSRHIYKRQIPAILQDLLVVQILLVQSPIKSRFRFAHESQLFKIFGKIDVDISRGVEQISIHGNSKGEISMLCLYCIRRDLQSNIVCFEVVGFLQFIVYQLLLDISIIEHE